jgi:hypothetical protein
VHALQVPLKQYLSVPQPDPFGRSTMLLQTGAPVVQEVVAMWQGFESGEAHGTPAWQPMQEPFEHTRSVPHDAPSDTFVYGATHSGVPLVQLVVPRLQAWP